MKSYESPVWHGESGLSRAQVINADDGTLILCFRQGDGNASISASTVITMDTAEALAANILTAIRAAQIKEAA